MGVIDDLSRDRPVPSLSGVPYVDLLVIFPGLTALLALCDPQLSRSLEDHFSAFSRVHELLRSLA